MAKAMQHWDFKFCPIGHGPINVSVSLPTMGDLLDYVTVILPRLLMVNIIIDIKSVIENVL